MANGREEEAIAFLVKYHGNNDPNSRLVLLEAEEMREGIKLDGIDKTWWDCTYPYRCLLRSLARFNFCNYLKLDTFVG